MIYEGFKIHSVEHIQEAYCTNPKCKKKHELLEVSNGFLSRALFCPVCKSVYVLKLERVTSTISKEFKQQCLDELERHNRERELVIQLNLEKEMRREGQRTAKIIKEEERLAKLKAKRRK